MLKRNINLLSSALALLVSFAALQACNEPVSQSPEVSQNSGNLKATATPCYCKTTCPSGAPSAMICTLPCTCPVAAGAGGAGGSVSGSGGSGGSVSTGSLTSTPVQLSATTVAAGSTLNGSVTYTNGTKSSITLSQVVIALRAPGGTHSGGPYTDMAPAKTNLVLAAGQSATVTASRAFTSSDTTGKWEAYSTSQQGTTWTDSTDSVYFTVGATTGGTGGTTGGTGGTGGTGSGTKAANYYVKDGSLYTACGEKIVLRGINAPVLWEDRNGATFPEIAKTGANSVRIFWAGGYGVAITAAEPAIKAALANGMVPILELHDSTCGWNMEVIRKYWIAADSVALIKKYQDRIIINIANEANPPNTATYLSTYNSIISDMRKAGIHAALMVDAGGSCGRNYQSLLTSGPAMLAADPDKNIVFSAHLYDTGTNYATVFKQFADAKLTFVVGEFANKSPPGCGGAINYKSLIAEAQKAGIGYIAWSWGTAASAAWNTDCAEFDMTSGTAYSTLQNWGKEVAVTDANSIQNTSVRPASLKNGGTCQ